MKANNYSFLFFYALFTCFCVAQNPTDSLSYYSQLVRSPKDGEDLIKSFRFFNIDKEQSLKQKDTIRVIYNLNYLASIQYKAGLYNDSENLAVQALTLLNQIDQTPYAKTLRTSLNNHLGMLYREQKNKDKALALYNDALALAETIEDSMKLFNNRSNVYKDLHEYQKAEEEIIKAYNMIPKSIDTLTIALIKDNLGFIYSKLNVERKALQLINEALVLREKSHNIIGLYSSQKSLTEYYKDRQNLVQARVHALKAYDIANQINSASNKADALGLLTSLSTDDFAKAYKKVNDSLFEVKQRLVSKFALLKYDISEYQRKVLESELDSEKQKRQKLLYLYITSFVLLGSIFAYFILKSKHKKERLLQVFNTEKRISKKVHDEVANDVYNVMTKLQNETNTNEDVLDHLESIYTKTRDISKENSNILVDQNFSGSLKDLLISYQNKELNVITKDASKIRWEEVSELKKITIYRVLQELMTNSRKHSNASIVVISFSKVTNKINIVYKDNGTGCNLIKGNGLQNTESRIASIDGSINFESEINNGFKAIMSI